MAESGIQGDRSVVWTFVIMGGDGELTITLPNNPSLVHNGRRTVWKLLGTSKLADAAAELIRSAGCQVIRHGETQTDEQTFERQQILGIMTGNDGNPLIGSSFVGTEEPEKCPTSELKL